MNTTTTLNALSAQMNAITYQFGVDACIEHADRVYSQSFRSEPFRICDMLNRSNLSMEEYYEEFNEIMDELWQGLASDLYEKCTGSVMPEMDTSIDYDDPYYDSMCMSLSYEQEDWKADRNAWIESNDIIASRFIKETTEIVELCNYKGEGEGGFVLFNEQSKKLPVFVSKRESFNI